MAVNPIFLAAMQNAQARRDASKQRRAETLAALASMGGAAVGGVAGGFAGGEFNPVGMATGLGVGQAAGQTLGGLAAGDYGHAAALQGAQNIPHGFNPMLQQAQEKQKAQTLADLAQAKIGDASVMPSSIREWQEYSQMSPENQALYLNMKRSGQIISQGGQDTYRAPSGQETVYPYVPKPLETPSGAAAVAGAKAKATADVERQTAGAIEREKEAGKTAAGKEAKAEQKKMAARGTLNLIEQLRAHPGRADVIGRIGAGIKQKIPGSNAAGFGALLEQFEGQSFLQGIEQARGTGPLSDAEGKRITSALSRVANTTQSDADWERAVSDLEDMVLEILAE